MVTQKFLKLITDDINRIYSSGDEKDNVGNEIEAFLNKKIKDLPLDKRIELIDELIYEYETKTVENVADENDLENEVFSKLFSLVLGKKVASADIPSAELMQRLAESLNTIFDTLNKMIGMININLFDEGVDDNTIRHIIGSQLEDENETQPLEDFLGQINKTFLITQQAFKKSAHTIVEQILDELHPVKINDSSRGRLKIGPMRKAENFDVFEEKYNKCKKWFESDRFMEHFIREFEKNCNTLSAK